MQNPEDDPIYQRELRLIDARNRHKIQRARMHQLDIYAEVAFRVLLETGEYTGPQTLAENVYRLACAMIEERDVQEAKL